MRKRRVRIINLAVLFFTAYCLLPTAYWRAAEAQRWGQGAPPIAGPVNSNPDVLKKVGIEQRLDQQVPLDLVFRDEQGREVRLAEYFGRKPVVLALVYYTCPMLCDQILSALTKAITTMSFDVGKEYDIVTVSFDARETAEQAAAKKKTYLSWYRREGADAGWHFLTGGEGSIQRLTQAVGFNYTFDPQTGQFAHASAIMVLTPEGKLSRYFYGIEYAPKDLKLGLVEASQNKIGSLVDQLLLYCFHYDPATGKYGFVVMNVVRVAGVLTIIGMFAIVFVMKRRARARRSDRAGGTI